MLMTNAEISAGLAALPAWRQDGTELVRELSFADFAAALAFINQVGALAEAVDHHPDLLLHGWNKVRLTLMTHSEGGLTRRDFDLAASIESHLAGQAA